ncbi:MAG: glycoside hydrolase family 3 N-terminal domain-containing protein [Roseiflexaceae bacterium]
MPTPPIAPRFKDASLPIAERIEDLLSQMTLDEKIAQLGCLWSTTLVRNNQFDPDYAASKMPHGIGQVTRIGASTGLHPSENAALMNQIQQVAIERTRLGIPLFVHEESVGGLCARDATVFPHGLGLAATWDAALVEAVADTIRQQMLAVGARLGLAPVLDIARDPRWGRVEETYGEDPILSGTLGSAYVRGLQTNDLRYGVVATGKHFLGYAMSEGGRNWGPVQMGQRELREVYAEPFAAAIRDAGLAGIMNSYASIDGIACAGSPAILTDLLRGELGFRGAVVADYWSIPQLERFHRLASNRGAAAAMALSAGLDMELPNFDYYHEPLKGEVEAGRLPIAVVDTAVRRVLQLKFELGLFEQPYVNAAAADAVFQTAEQRALARTAAAKGTILLKNDGILPLKPGLKRIAMVGPGADDQRLLQGDYHYPTHQESIFLAPPKSDDPNLIGGEDLVPQAGGAFAVGPYYTPHITPLAGLRAALGDQVEITHAQGCEVLGDDRSGIAAAVEAALRAEIAIVVVAGKSGLHRPVTVGEANDATNLDLTGVQAELVTAVAATGTPTIVVVISGRVHTLSAIVDHANALALMFPPGEEGGSALAEILTGAISPSGRLPVTLPRSVGQIPIHRSYRAGGGMAMFFGDYIDSPTSPLFAFGHGLSYTSFSYEGLSITSGSTNDLIRVSFTLRNSGERAGEEVVQLYVRDDIASVVRPDQQLIGFARVALAAGEARQVTFTIHPSRLAFYNIAMQFVTEPGEFSFSIGASSADIRATQTITLSGEVAHYRQREIIATSVQVE